MKYLRGSRDHIERATAKEKLAAMGTGFVLALLLTIGAAAADAFARPATAGPSGSGSMLVKHTAGEIASSESGKACMYAGSKGVVRGALFGGVAAGAAAPPLAPFIGSTLFMGSITLECGFTLMDRTRNGELVE